MPAASSTQTELARDAVVQRLVGRRADQDPRPRLKAVVDRWREESGQTRLAIDVFGLVSMHGIKLIRTEMPKWDGRVYADADGAIVMEINSRHLLVRQRFTAAHELVHTAFPGFVRERRYRVDDDLGAALFSRNRSEEEQLCDWGAATLLMPDELIWSYRADQGLQAVEKLAGDAKVSLEAAATRLIERSQKPAVFLVLHEDKSGQLRVRYTKVQHLPLFVPRGAAADKQSVFARAAKTGSRERDLNRLPSRSRRLFHIEAKSYPLGRGANTRERVLALAWPQNPPPRKAPT